MKIYKIRSQFQWKRFSDSIFFLVVSIGSGIYFYLSNNDGYLFSALLLIPVIISASIHYNYRKHDLNKKVTIDTEKSILTFHTDNYSKQFSFNQINKIIFFRGRKDRFMGAYTLPFSNYHFYEFITENDSFILTNLCFDEEVYDLPRALETRIRFFNYIPKN